MNRDLIFCCAAFCILIASCAKDEITDPSVVTEKAGHANGPVVYLTPSGGDDTQAFIDAIAAAEPGTVIQLTGGDYYVGLMEIYDFHGSIVGSGMGKTIIHMKTPIPLQSQVDRNMLPAWWRLIAGEIVITDIAFVVPDGFVADDYDPYWFGRDLYSMFMMNNYNETYYEPYGDLQKVLFRNVSFSGGTNTDMSEDVYWVTENNTWLGIWVGGDYYWPTEGVVYPLTSGNYVFTNCCFDNFLNVAEGFSLGDKAFMEVSDSRISNTWAPMYFTANYNSIINITRNVFMNSRNLDILIEDYDWGVLDQTTIEPLKRCQYNITGNIFNFSAETTSLGFPYSSIILTDYWAAIDTEARLPMLFNIKGNQFNLSVEGTGILANNSQDLVIRNNHFSGTCSAGILIDGIDIYDVSGTLYPAPFAENALLLGNNFSRLNPSEACVIFGQKTKNCSVVGNGKDGVIDLGTDNKIVGMKKMQGGTHMGPSIRDNFRMMPKMRAH